MNDRDNSAIGATRLPLNGALLAAWLSFLFGANAVAVKISLQGMGPLTNAGLRFSFSGLILLAWAVLQQKDLRIKKRDWHHLLIIGFGFFAQLSLFYLGLRETTASHATLIVNMLPFMVLILAHFLIPGERARRPVVAGMVLGFSGIALLFFDEVSGNQKMIKGDVIIFAAIMIWGINVVYMKRLFDRFQPLQITLYPMLVAAPLFWLSALIAGEQLVGQVSLEVGAALGYQILVTGSLGMVAWNSLVKQYGATTIHAFVFIMPISGVMLGVFLLKEPVTVNLVGAVVLVVSGLLVVNYHRPHHERKRL